MSGVDALLAALRDASGVGDDLRAIDDPTVRCGMAGDLIAECKRISDEARGPRDDAAVELVETKAAKPAAVSRTARVGQPYLSKLLDRARAAAVPASTGEQQR